MSKARAFCFGNLRQASFDINRPDYAERLQAPSPSQSRRDSSTTASKSTGAFDSHLHMIVTAVRALYIIAQKSRANRAAQRMAKSEANGQWAARSFELKRITNELRIQ